MPNFPFSQEDCKQILQLLNKSKSKSSFANQLGNFSNHEELSGKDFLSYVMESKSFGFWILAPHTTSCVVLNFSHPQNVLKTIMLNYQMVPLLL
ncbi:hypothetical protein ACFX16_000973 [Malus domestica]